MFHSIRLLIPRERRMTSGITLDITLRVFFTYSSILNPFHTFHTSYTKYIGRLSTRPDYHSLETNVA